MTGQARGFLVSKIAPALRAGQRVLYLGDWDRCGHDIEAHTRRTLAEHSECWKPDGLWERVALTTEQVEQYALPVISKIDRRHKPPRSTGSTSCCPNRSRTYAYASGASASGPPNSCGASTSRRRTTDGPRPRRRRLTLTRRGRAGRPGQDPRAVTWRIAVVNQPVLCEFTVSLNFGSDFHFGYILLLRAGLELRPGRGEKRLMLKRVIGLPRGAGVVHTCTQPDYLNFSRPCSQARWHRRHPNAGTN